MSDLNFTSAGKGEVIVLLHGFCETHHIWKGFQQELSTDYSILCPDLPGFGDSPLTLSDFSLEDIADQLYLWLQALNIKTCTIIGHSMGGYIGLIFARKYPSTTCKLGLFHSTVFADAKEKIKNRNKIIAFINRSGLEYFVDNFFSSLFHTKNLEKTHVKEALKNISKRAKLLKAADVIAYIKAMRDRESSETWIKSYDKNVLFIAGLHDFMIPIADSREQGKLPKNSTSLELSESAHMGMFEQPELALSIIREFMTL